MPKTKDGSSGRPGIVFFGLRFGKVRVTRVPALQSRARIVIDILGTTGTLGD